MPLQRALTAHAMSRIRLLPRRAGVGPERIIASRACFRTSVLDAQPRRGTKPRPAENHGVKSLLSLQPSHFRRYYVSFFYTICLL
jgi:hypothetical protein